MLQLRSSLDPALSADARRAEGFKALTVRKLRLRGLKVATYVSWPNISDEPLMERQGCLAHRHSGDRRVPSIVRSRTIP